MNARKRGSAGVEFSLLVPVVALMAGCFVGFMRLSLLRQRALAAAEFGATLASEGAVSPADVRSEMDDYMRGLGEAHGGRWRWSTGRFDDTAASRFYRMVISEVAVEGRWPIRESVVVQQAPEAAL